MLNGWTRRIAAVFCAGFLFVGAGEITSRAANVPPAIVEVKIDNFMFAPMDLTIAVGTTVKWINHDDIPHTVVSEDKTTFKSKAMDTDESFSYTFNQPGTYTYFCSIHPKMVAKIIVK
jgi:plastocyanin